MRCKMCGAKLKKSGNICKNCYADYKKQEKLLAEDEQELLKLKRKYSPKFNLLKSGEFILLLIITALAGFSSFGNLGGILISILCIVIFGAWMFFCKKRAMGTKVIFFETKLKYKAKYPLVDREEAIPYDDIKDVSYFQSKSQRICKVADIRFYTKGFLSGLTIHDIPDIEENFEKIKDIINASRG